LGTCAQATGTALLAADFAELQVRYRTLLDEGEALNPPNRPGGGNNRKPKQSTATNLLRRLRAYEDETLRFAEDARVPFTNNLAERAIRMPKVKQKISGCFRTAAGARTFCVICSYFATLAKQKRDLLGSLVMALQGLAPDLARPSGLPE
jgi:transposase